jgi:hypothetical protein
MKHKAIIFCVSSITAWSCLLQAVPVHVVAPGIEKQDPRAAIAEEVRVQIMRELEETDLELERYAEALVKNHDLIALLSKDERSIAQSQVVLMRTIIAAAKTNDTSLMDESKLRTLLEVNRDVLKQAVRHKRAIAAGRPAPDVSGLRNRSYQNLPTSVEDLLKILVDVRSELTLFAELPVHRAESLMNHVVHTITSIPYATIVDRVWPYALLGAYFIYATAPDKMTKAGFGWLMPMKRFIGGVKGSKPVAAICLAADGQTPLASPEQIKAMEGRYDFEKKAEMDKSAPVSAFLNAFSIKVNPKESLVTVAVLGTVKDRILEDYKAIKKHCSSYLKKAEKPTHTVANASEPLSYDARMARCVAFCAELCIEPEMIRVHDIVAMTDGCSEHEMSALLSMAREYAHAEERAVGYAHIDQAIDTQIRHIDYSRFPRDPRRVACARAGEALCIALLRDGVISKVTIHPVCTPAGTYSDGAVFVEAMGLRDRASLKRACMRAVAGLAAHDVLGIEPSIELMVHAKREAFDAAYLFVCDGATDNQLTEARRESAKNEAWGRVEQSYQTVRDLLALNKELLEGVADRLMRYGSIDRDLLIEVMKKIAID